MCAACSIRALPETEIPPATRGDHYFVWPKKDDVEFGIEIHGGTLFSAQKSMRALPFMESVQEWKQGMAASTGTLSKRGVQGAYLAWMKCRGNAHTVTRKNMAEKNREINVDIC